MRIEVSDRQPLWHSSIQQSTNAAGSNGMQGGEVPFSGVSKGDGNNNGDGDGDSDSEGNGDGDSDSDGDGKDKGNGVGDRSEAETVEWR